jgi:hypothetical protein
VAVAADADAAVSMFLLLLRWVPGRVRKKSLVRSALSSGGGCCVERLRTSNERIPSNLCSEMSYTAAATALIPRGNSRIS